MPKISRRTLRILCGVSLLALGIAGLGLPVLQGWFFILMGILLLAEDIPFFQRLADRLKQGLSAFAKA
jgi:uncharacterized membrane protein YbaN (DUF454 family)